MSVPEIFLLLGLVFSIGGAIVLPLLTETLVPRALAIFGSAAAACLLATSALLLLGHSSLTIHLVTLPLLGTLRLHIGGLSAFFSLTLGISFLPAYLFSDGYMRRYQGHFRTRNFASFFLLLLPTCFMVLAAGDVITFLLFWRIMSLLASLTIVLENTREAVGPAGYLFLSMNEAGIIVVTVALLIMAGFSGGHIGFAAIAASMHNVSAPWRWIFFLMLFFGFSTKAGLVPVSSWLPRAHPLAPANASAILSGALVNFGIYGIIRFVAILLPSTGPLPGLIVLIVGALSALIGILFATIESDIKKMLAHSTIENMGIIAVNIGMALVFTAEHLPVLASIAYIVALYHMLNHSAYKTLLFLGAGSIDQHVGTRNMNRLGGLLKRMPVIGATFLIGALAIAAMPPLNGFVTEWLTLQNILRSEEIPSTLCRVIFALCGTGLALGAALAVTCFLKAFAMSFLGMPRSQNAADAREADFSAKAPMLALAALCLVLGVGATWIIPGISRAVPQLADHHATAALVPPFFAAHPPNPPFKPQFISGFKTIGAGVGAGVIPARGLVILHQGGKSNPVVYAMSTFYMAIILALIMAATWVMIRLVCRRSRAAIGAPWAGGMRDLAPEMTYSATGFSNPVRVIFQTFFSAGQREDSKVAVESHFRTAIRREQSDVYLFDRIFLAPIAICAVAISRLLARIHRPSVVNAYAAWVFVILLVALVVNRLL